MIHQCEKCGIYTNGDYYKIYPKPGSNNNEMIIMCPKCGKDYIYTSSWAIAQSHFKRHNGVIGHDYNGVKYVNFQDGTHMTLEEYRNELKERLISYFTGLRSWSDYAE